MGRIEKKERKEGARERRRRRKKKKDKEEKREGWRMRVSVGDVKVNTILTSGLPTVYLGSEVFGPTQ